MWRNRWLVGAWLLLGGGCSYTFDGNQPDIPLIGNPPPTGSLPRLNHAPAESLQILRGGHGSLWATFQELLPTPSGPQKGLRMVNLDQSGAEETLIADDVSRYDFAFYIVARDKAAMMPTKLTIHTLGEPALDDVFMLPAGPGALLVSGPQANLFLYWAQSMDTTTYLVQWRDRRFSRTLPVLDGVNKVEPLAAGGFAFSSDGKLLFTRDGNGQVVRHSTLSEEDVKLADSLSPAWELDEGEKAILSCGPTGVKQTFWNPALAERVLDPDPCDTFSGFLAGKIVYVVSGEHRKVRLDGTGAPETVLPAGVRLIGNLPSMDDKPLYSRDRGDRYVNGVGDGWLDDWRFMDRGGDVDLSVDGKKLRWIENAATPSGVGDLVTASIPRGAPATLARNVFEYSELGDGRILVAENHAFRGVQNRVVVLDESKNLKRWVADHTGGYHFISRSELIVDVVSGATGYDFVRVPIPGDGLP